MLVCALFARFANNNITRPSFNPSIYLRFVRSTVVTLAVSYHGTRHELTKTNWNNCKYVETRMSRINLIFNTIIRTKNRRNSVSWRHNSWIRLTHCFLKVYNIIEHTTHTSYLTKPNQQQVTNFLLHWHTRQGLLDTKRREENRTS